MLARYDVITTYLSQWDPHFVQPAVFGTTEPQKIASLIDTFCIVIQIVMKVRFQIYLLCGTCEIYVIR